MSDSSKITVLCAMDNSNYYQIPNLDIYNKQRNAYTYTGNNFIIAHPPCQQWSRLKFFALENKQEKDLAPFCLEQVNKNGGILEHPHGTTFFKEMGIPKRKLYLTWQSWFGFPCKKPTLLYIKDVELLPVPLNFDAIQKTVDQLHSRQRSHQTLEFCEYLVNSVRQSKKYLEKSALIST